MTTRLEQAIQQLNPQQLEELTAFAENLATDNALNRPDTPKQWKLDWVGAMADRPEKSGVEAQQTAMEMWKEMLRRGPTR